MDSIRHEQFAEAFVRHQDRVYAYIVTMLPNRHDAEDVFQQTSLILWQKWEQFDPAQDFIRWACGIARNEVRNFLRTRGKNRLVLSEKLLDGISDERLRMQPVLEERRRLLLECMKKLDFLARELLQRFYAGQEPIKVLARAFRITPTAVYLRLRRLRRELLECIEQSSKGESEL